MRQMTMTQLFDPIESPRSRNNSTFIKNEPNTPSADTTMFMPESLIGLAQPTESLSDIENEQVTSCLIILKKSLSSFRIIYRIKWHLC